MQFLLIGYDGTDVEAPARRAAVREAHLQGARLMKQAGIFLEGGAILNDQQEMIGSMMLLEFQAKANSEPGLIAILI